MHTRAHPLTPVPSVTAAGAADVDTLSEARTPHARRCRGLKFQSSDQLLRKF